MDIKKPNRQPNKTPRKNGEKKAQQECFVWAYNNRPEVRGLLASIENAETGGARKVMQAKAAGMLPGFADMVLLMPRNGYHGLFIELKCVGGRQSPAQKTFEANVTEQGYLYEIVFVEPQAIEAFKLVLDKYLGYL